MAGSLERRRRPVEGSGSGVGNVSDPGEVQEPLEGPEQDSMRLRGTFLTLGPRIWFFRILDYGSQISDTKPIFLIA